MPLCLKGGESMKAKAIISAGMITGVAVASIIAFAGMSCAAQSGADQRREEATVMAVEPAVPARSATAKVHPGNVAAEEIVGQTEAELGKADACLLKKIAMAEAEGEDAEGKALVMLVVLNRVRSDKFPDTVKEVIYQEGQFSPISDGRFDMVEPDADCWDALKLVERGWDKSMGATYFESESDSTWHKDNLKFLFRHGAHSFYTDKGE